MSEATAQTRRRGRRPRTHARVLAATSELLETTPLARLSVAQILEAAGVGRTSFYEHFSSKEDVVVKLLRDVSTEVGDAIEPMFATGEQAPERAFREGLGSLVEVTSRHAALMVTATEQWPEVPELRRLWFRLHAELTTRIAAVIESERAAGRAPAGADAAGLAACLVWSTERVLHVARRAGGPTPRGHAELVEPLVQLYVGAIYRRAVTVDQT